MTLDEIRAELRDVVQQQMYKSVAHGKAQIDANNLHGKRGAHITYDDFFALADRIGELQAMLGELETNPTKGTVTAPPAIATNPPKLDPLSFKFAGFGGEAVSMEKENVHLVTNLNDGGRGSLAAAPENCHIVFLVSGDIYAGGSRIRTPHWHVLGQTSPCGVQIRSKSNPSEHPGSPYILAAKDHIWQHTRFRPSLPTKKSAASHCALMLEYAEGLVVDHMSLNFGEDDVFDAHGSKKVSILNNLIGETTKGIKDFSPNTLIGNSSEITLAGNVFFLGTTRCAKIGNSRDVDAYNNVTYGAGRGMQVEGPIKNTGPTRANLRNNLTIRTASSSTSWRDVETWEAGSDVRVYASGNMVLERGETGVPTKEAVIIDSYTGKPSPPHHFVDRPFEAPHAEMIDMRILEKTVFAGVGASHNRDDHDRRIIQNMENRVDVELQKSPEHYGGWPTMKAGNKKPIIPWDESAPDKLSNAIKKKYGIHPGTNTLKTKNNGGTTSDFLCIINKCFGL